MMGKIDEMLCGLAMMSLLLSLLQQLNLNIPYFARLIFHGHTHHLTL